MAKRFVVFLLLFCVGLGLFVGSMDIKEVKATDELFEFCNTGDNEYHKIYGTEWYAQTFTPSLPHNITYIKLKMFRGGSPGTLNVSLRSTSAGKPTGSDLTYGTTNASTFTTDFYGEWYQINLTEYTLTVDTQYAIACRVLDGNSSNYVRWRLDVTGTYDDGSHTTTIDNGTTWTIPFPNYDFMFEEWGELQEYPYYYVVHGPYFEDGTVADKLVNLTLQIEDLPNQKYALNGTDDVADTVQIYLVNPGIVFTWNISSYGNATRTFYLTNASYEEIWIFIPDLSQESVYLYTFTVNDLVGVTNGYLESIINVGGQNRIVERQALDVVNTLPFWMVFSKKYEMRVVCDQGSYTWSFIALTEQTQSLIIVPGMFPETYPGLNVTVTAKRRNTTWIQVNYSDAGLLTTWVHAAIKYKLEYAYVTIKSYNQSGNNTAQFNWYAAIADKDYVVKVTSLRGSDTETWSFDCSVPSDGENPWDDLEGLGSWPIEAKYVIGLFIVLAVFGVTSYANMAAGCVVGVIAAGLLNLMGWLDIPWSLLCLGFSLAIFAAIKQGKKREYELEAI